MASYRHLGAAGLAHGNRGRPSSRRVPRAVRVKILVLAKGKFRDFNDQHFTEVLAEEYAIRLSRSTVRRIRREADLAIRASGEPAAITRGGNATRRWGCCYRWMAVTTTGWKDGGPSWSWSLRSMMPPRSSSAPASGTKRMRLGTS